MSLVSIIIPIYNVEAYLDTCVNRVRKQTYSNIEILLIEDGSPDRCGEMCDAYAREDERIRVIHKKNEGIAAARNTGIALATGEYLLFVDGKDYIDKGLVERILELAQEKKADIVMFDSALVEPDGSIHERISMELPEGEVISAKGFPNLIFSGSDLWNKMFRTEFLRESGVRFPEGYSFEAIGTLPIWFVLAKRVVYTRRLLYYERMRDDSVQSSQELEQEYSNRTAMLDGVRAFFLEKGLAEQYSEELEYLVFEQGYYEPAKTILKAHQKCKLIQQYRNYARSCYPNLTGNSYVKKLSCKEKVLWGFLWIQAYLLLQIACFVCKLCERRRKSL